MIIKIETDYLYIFFFCECDLNMTTSPVSTPRHSQTEIVTDLPVIQEPILIESGSISERNDVPDLLKSDDQTSLISCHGDENNENEAVSDRRKRFLFKKKEFL